MSKEEKNVYEILSDIQANIKAPKTRKTNLGGGAGYNYRNVDDITEALKPFIKKHNVSFVCDDSIDVINDVVFVHSVVSIIDSDGNRVSVNGYAELSKNSRQSPMQATGTSSSYARKYALQALLALDDSLDVDSQDYQDNYMGDTKQKKPSNKSVSKKTKSKTDAGNDAYGYWMNKLAEACKINNWDNKAVFKWIINTKHKDGNLKKLDQNELEQLYEYVLEKYEDSEYIEF